MHSLRLPQRPHSLWPLPALAATPVYKGTVGPGFTIKMATKPTKAGQGQDRRQRQVEHPQLPPHGAGSEREDDRLGVGTKTFTVTLKKGTYKFICDPHPFMKGSFTVR